MAENSTPDARDWVIARMQHFEIMLETTEKLNRERYETLQESIRNARTAMEERFNLAKEMVVVLVEAQRSAVNKAEIAVEKRFDSVNEFRAQLGDQSRTLMPRTEAEVLFKGQGVRLDATATAISSLETRLAAFRAERGGEGAGFKSGWVLALGAGTLITVILSVAGFVLSMVKK